MKALLPFILVIFSLSSYGQDSTKIDRKPTHKFSVGLIGGAVLADNQFYDLFGDTDFKEQHNSAGISIEYHFTKKLGLMFQPAIYNIHAKQYPKGSGKLYGKYDLTTLLLPLYFDLHNTNRLQFHFYAGIFYSNIINYKGERYFTTGSGNDTTIYTNYLKQYYTHNNGNIGFSGGFGLSYSYKRFQLGAQILYMVGFSRYNAIISREQGYAPVNATLVYSFM